MWKESSIQSMDGFLSEQVLKGLYEFYENDFLFCRHRNYKNNSVRLKAQSFF